MHIRIAHLKKSQKLVPQRGTAPGALMHAGKSPVHLRVGYQISE
jgi:hypothetical protein